MKNLKNSLVFISILVKSCFRRFRFKLYQRASFFIFQMDPPASPRHFQPFYPDIPSQINLQQHPNSSVPLRHDPDQSSRPINRSSSASSTYSKAPMDDPTTYTNPPPSLHPTAQRHAFTVDSQRFS